jgi:serine protease
MRFYLMSTRSHRINTLAFATAVALAAIAAPSFAGQAHVSGLKTGEVYDRFIVKYRDGSAPTSNTAAFASSLSGAASRAVLPSSSKGKKLNLQHLRRMAFGADVVTSSNALNSTEAAALIRQIAADPNVEWVQPDYVMRAFAVPNDPRFTEQWHYADSAVGIRAPIAWNTSTGTGIVVAVIDTGIASHTDLNANVLPGYDMIASASVANDGDGRDADPTDNSGTTSFYHGTHVAGTVAASTNNGLGVAGVAYNAKIVPIRVLGNGGSGNLSDVADAIVWASGGSVSGVPANANPAEVINLSLGADAPCSQTPALQTAVTTATNNGSVVVAAAGNSNIDVAGATPAGCSNVISVAASDRGGRRAYYSSYGASVDVTAPGGEICTPATEFLPLGQDPNGKCTAARFPANGVLSTINNNGYAIADWQGTSMASPHVAGIVALIQAASATPKTTAQIEQILKSTARPIAAADCPGGCGAGIVDAAAAVAAVAGGTPGNQAPVANFTSSVSGLTVSFSDSSSDSDGSIASRSWNFGDGTTSTATSPSKTYSAAGTYTVTLTVTDNGGATHTKTASVTVSSGTGGVQTYSNGTDANIPDNNATGVSSTISVSGRSGNAPSNAVVSVNIVHTYQGDLIVDLIAPDGSVYNLHNRTGDAADNIVKTYTVNLSSEALNGAWKLRAVDRASQDVGKIDTWSIKF